MSKIITAALFVVLAGFVSNNECPPETLTRPCTCERAGGLTLSCGEITRKDDLEGVFRRTGNIHFENFELDSSSIPSIPSSSLAQKQFTSLSVIESNLTTLFDANSSVSNVFQTIRLESAVFQDGFPWAQFQNLKQLRFFLVKRVEIPTLDSEFTNNVNKGLKLLMLLNTKTSHLVDGMFSQYKSLVDVRIQEAELTILKRSYFPRPAEIQILAFDGNRIQSLPIDIFAAMPKLRSVLLSKNRLSIVSQTVFSGVFDQLSTLVLADNPINCDCRIRWIASKRKQRYLDGRCAAPVHLKDKKLTDLQSNDFRSCK